MHVPILVATIAILIVAIVVLYHQLLHPYSHRPTFKSAFTRILGSVGTTLLVVLFFNSIVWILLWGNDWGVLFTERNIVLYGIVMLFALFCSLVFTIWKAWQFR
jgi:hypothetical protein